MYIFIYIYYIYKYIYIYRYIDIYRYIYNFKNIILQLQKHACSVLQTISHRFLYKKFAESTGMNWY